jgi:hypothetical protein
MAGLWLTANGWPSQTAENPKNTNKPRRSANIKLGGSLFAFA